MSHAQTSTLRTVLPTHKNSMLLRNTNIIRFNQDEIPAKIDAISLEMSTLQERLEKLNIERNKLEAILVIVTE